MKAIEVPGKVFLMGEYSVIRGGQALLAPVKPAYSYGIASSASPHPDSPYGCFLKDFKSSSKGTFVFETGGPGPGFGSSTAELIAGARVQGSDAVKPSELLTWYQDRFPGTSGADLLVQAIANDDSRVLYWFSNRGNVERILPDPEVLRRILLFKANPTRKLHTHQDLLVRRSELDLNILNELCGGFVKAIQGDLESGFSLLNEFARILSESGYETSYAREIRESLRKHSGVCAVKGCGAGLNDVFMVVLEYDIGSEQIEQITRHAESLGILPIGRLEDRLW